MATTAGTVRLEHHGAARTLSWRRPPLNVFDHDLLERVAEALRGEEIRHANLLVLRGGYGAWSAGLSVADHMGAKLSPMFAAFHDLLRAIWEVPVPTLAVVEGPCLGGGLELLLPCDMALASASATFGQPEVRLGVFPPVALAALSRQVGPKAAAEILFTGRTLSAERAALLGLVSRSVPDAELEGELDGVVRAFSSHRHETLTIMKRLWQAADPFPWQELSKAEAGYLKEIVQLPDAEEGLRAFLEKRAPVWPTPSG